MRLDRQQRKTRGLRLSTQGTAEYSRIPVIPSTCLKRTIQKKVDSSLDATMMIQPFAAKRENHKRGRLDPGMRIWNPRPACARLDRGRSPWPWIHRAAAPRLSVPGARPRLGSGISRSRERPARAASHAELSRRVPEHPRKWEAIRPSPEASLPIPLPFARQPDRRLRTLVFRRQGGQGTKEPTAQRPPFLLPCNPSCLERLAARAGRYA